MKYGTLTVENFGPIKKAEIDLNQVMLFIGPQGSGKSTILRLMAALHRFPDTISVNSLHNNKELIDQIQQLDFINYFNNYKVNNYFNNDTFIRYEGKYNIWEYKNNIHNLIRNDYANRSTYPTYSPCYMPAEKAFLYTYLNIVNTLLIKEVPIPYILKNFAYLFEKARNEVQNPNLTYLDVRYKFEDGQDRVYFDADHFVPLSESSSGIQTSIPLGNIIESINYEDKTKNSRFPEYHSVFIEEPELNLFPITQKKLIEFIFSRLINFHNKRHLLYIETHSPYILIAINNLIQAGNVYKKDPSLEKKIAEIIPKDCWLDFDKVSAYYIENGGAKNILNSSERSITADVIDQVSETMALDFDKLLDLEYPS